MTKIEEVTPCLEKRPKTYSARKPARLTTAMTTGLLQPKNQMEAIEAGARRKASASWAAAKSRASHTRILGGPSISVNAS